MHTTAHIYANNTYSVFMNLGRSVSQGDEIRWQ